MKTDKELLELSARAAGLKLYFSDKADCELIYTYVEVGSVNNLIEWSPLTDDGDALRLSVKLKIPMSFPGWGDEIEVWAGDTHIEEDGSVDLMQATRRAIVRAAAEIQLQKERGHATK